MNVLQTEPAAVIGLVATIIVGVLTQVAGSGIVDAKGVDVLNTIIAVIPVIAGLLIRQFVSPVASSTPPVGSQPGGTTTTYPTTPAAS